MEGSERIDYDHWVPATAQEIRLFYAATGISRWELYVLLLVALLLGIFAWRFGDIVRAFGERKAVYLLHERESKRLAAELDEETERRSRIPKGETDDR